MIVCCERNNMGKYCKKVHIVKLGRYTGLSIEIFMTKFEVEVELGESKR